jgi:hypothetical protein
MLWVGTTVTMGGGGAVVIIEAFLIKLRDEGIITIM